MAKRITVRAVDDEAAEKWRRFAEYVADVASLSPLDGKVRSSLAGVGPSRTMPARMILAALDAADAGCSFHPAVLVNTGQAGT